MAFTAFVNETARGGVDGTALKTRVELKGL